MALDRELFCESLKTSSRDLISQLPEQWQLGFFYLYLYAPTRIYIREYK